MAGASCRVRYTHPPISMDWTRPLHQNRVPTKHHSRGSQQDINGAPPPWVHGTGIRCGAFFLRALRTGISIRAASDAGVQQPAVPQDPLPWAARDGPSASAAGPPWHLDDLWVVPGWHQPTARQAVGLRCQVEPCQSCAGGPRPHPRNRRQTLDEPRSGYVGDRRIAAWPCILPRWSARGCSSR